MQQLAELVKTGWTLLRFIAVISSSIVTILSSLLPLVIYTSLSTEYLIFMFVLLSIAATIVHGGLTHLLNDYADFSSGTDAYSPAKLSGGSRVIQEKLIPPKIVKQLGQWLSILLLLIAGVMLTVGRYEITSLIVIGVWAAYSYSVPPLQLSYHPFVGEWFSLFPAIFFLGLAGPWIILDSIPLWAYQNAVINALVCMAWVMVHHIPDIDSDRKATPIKRTTVVWLTDKFGKHVAYVPAFLYLTLAGLCALWLMPTRLFAAFVLVGIILVAIIIVFTINPKNLQQVTNVEKTLLLLAIMIAIMLGIV